MSCEHMHEQISRLLDQKLDAGTRGVVLGHLAACRPCQDTFTAYERVRASLRSMNSAPVPPRLTAQLRIAASKDRVNKLTRRTFGGRTGNWFAWARLSVDNMMRPLALPFAGGLLSAFLMFSSLVPTLAFQREVHNDVPISLFTEPALEEIGYRRISSEDMVLHLTIDERGRVSDAVSSQGKLTPQMENDLLFYRFAPATAFGYPTWGKTKVVIPRGAKGGHIVVRG